MIKIQALSLETHHTTFCHAKDLFQINENGSLFLTSDFLNITSHNYFLIQIEAFDQENQVN